MGRVAAVPRRPDVAVRPVADVYDRVRPGYPDEALDALVTLARLPRRGRILEAGAGTGQLTVPLAERGYHVTAVEVGEHLAERLRRNVREYDDVDVICARFEDVQLRQSSFDLVTAATRSTGSTGRLRTTRRPPCCARPARSG